MPTAFQHVQFSSVKFIMLLFSPRKISYETSWKKIVKYDMIHKFKINRCSVYIVWEKSEYTAIKNVYFR